MSAGFDTAADGYDRDQVNTVLQGVNERYQQLYNQYTELHTQASALQMENERLRTLLMQYEARDRERETGLATTEYSEPAQRLTKDFPDEATFRRFMDLIVRHALGIIRDTKALTEEV